jgi:hypothetical protein
MARQEELDRADAAINDYLRKPSSFTQAGPGPADQTGPRDSYGNFTAATTAAQKNLDALRAPTPGALLTGAAGPGAFDEPLGLPGPRTANIGAGPRTGGASGSWGQPADASAPLMVTQAGIDSVRQRQGMAPLPWSGSGPLMNPAQPAAAGPAPQVSMFGVTDKDQAATRIAQGRAQGLSPATTGLGEYSPGATLSSVGNPTPLTDAANAETAAAQKQFDAKYQGAPSFEKTEQDRADRFSRFVNESNTASFAHDIAKGGSARDILAKTAALNAMGGIDANNRATATASAANETTRRGQTLAAQSEAGRQEVLTKGQKLQHDAALASILGSPAHQQSQLLDAEIKKGTVKTAQAANDVIEQMTKAYNAGDVEKVSALAALLRQLQSKDAEKKFHPSEIRGAVGSDANGLPTKEADRLLVTDVTTGKVIDPGAAAAKAPTTITKPTPAPKGLADGLHTFGPNNQRVRVKDGIIYPEK